ncbi:MAG: fumarylacetoacetate hydrolase family protein [Filifactoraceae bacterium]
MEFLRGLYNNKEVLGVKNGERVYLTCDLGLCKDITSMIELIKILDEPTLEKLRLDIVADKVKSIALDEIKLLAPIDRPIHDLICVGVNYSDHLAEVSSKIQINESSAPVYFSKRACKLTGPDEDIYGHLSLDHRLDYEVELAIIIGKEGKNIPLEKAEEYIFGYSISNDMTSRTLQKNHDQWYKGKSLDGFSILGPWIVEKSDLSLPLKLDIQSYINGELRQNSNTSYLISDIPKLISIFSQGCTLEPGDIILTGTPSGVGMGFKPSKFLKSGDTVECKIQGIGVLKNKII